MSDIVLDAQAAPSAPSSGQGVIYIDSISKLPSHRNDAGVVSSLGPSNFSVAAQLPVAVTRTYIAGSALAIPSGKLQIGSCFRWTFDLTKTAAGIAASTFDICFGTTGTIVDTARVSFTKPAGTAAIDTAAVTITAICRGPLSASGIVAGNFSLVKNAAEIAGHCATPSVNLTTVSSGFDVTAAGLIAGVCVTSGLADVLTIQMVMAEAWNM